MKNLFLKDTLKGFIILFIAITVGYFAPEVIVVLAAVVFALMVCFLTGFLVSLILGGFKK